MKVSIRSSYISFIFLVFISIIPFVYLPDLFNPYEFPKFILLAIFSLIVGNIVLMLILFRKKISVNISKLDIAVMAFISILLIADIFGESVIDSLLGSSYRLQGFITYLSLGYLYLIARFCSSQIKQELLHQLFSIQLAGISGFLIVQFLLASFEYFQISLFQNRFHGTFGNPNFAGGYMAMLFAYILFWNSSGSLVYKVKPVVLLLGGIAIVLTDSRSAILGVVVSIMIYFLTLGFKAARYRIFIFSLLLLSIVSCLFLVIRYSIHERRISEWENRSIIWNQGLHLIEQKPILGYGQENIGIVFPENLHFAVDNIHNIFLEYTISAGIVGLFTFCTVLAFAFRNVNTSGRFLIVAFLISACFNPLSISQLLLFWAVIGIGKSNSV